MKFIKYLLVGIVFGIILTKSEVTSWYRIYEMFQFQSFHMYGVIGSAVVIGIIALWVIKKMDVRDVEGMPVAVAKKGGGIFRLLIGGTIFGLGWAMTGACPGPMFIILGQGYSIFALVILSATLGAFVYGVIRHRLPH